MKSSESWLQTASLEEIKRGYMEEGLAYICVCCGYRTEAGIIYPEEGVLYEAARYMRVHIEKVHGSVFEYLLELDKSVTGLSDVQRGLLAQFYEGKKDAEVQKALGIGSASTIRNHRFVLKEKERQAKIFLALMELLKSKDTQAPAEWVSPVTRHGHTIHPNSFDITEQDREKVLNKYFPEGNGGPLTTFHMQQKHKYIVLTEIAKRFETERKYSEKQVNELLKEVNDDYVEIRRYLIDYGLLEREPDGSQYWLGSHTDQQSAKVGKQERKEKGEQEKMNRRKELQEQAKEVKTEAGVYQIRNERNGKVYIDSTLNLKTINGQRFMLQMGSHLNRRLQAEWNEYGETAFVIEVLETLKQDDNPYYDSKDALAKCLNRWFEQLEPYGDQGYHGDKKQSV
ncbi:DUF2087 domain-containing protein [Paenibacillus amylolyticus]|uniref:DUF2087 domain-containing protein n=1 Tax=Paenibacillus amylolyticus TaxID=1451 RepID=UPI00105A111F|nr:DUF2087 domain-containing protein [Paenibacillus amylolyticus]TDL63298.1 DUF2087 domain-containing protein [Paenibacillus amylolyticus]UOK64007.1 DUF2087 domain-containing protein [Paenibacillus sp. OVF10]